LTSIDSSVVVSFLLFGIASIHAVHLHRQL